jgi:soluble lytic murein transglycosylase
MIPLRREWKQTKMTDKYRGFFKSVCLGLALTVLATFFTIDGAVARKEDSEPGVTDTFGRHNKRVSSSSIDVQAVNAALLKKFRTALPLAQKSRNNLTKTVVEWLYLRQEPKKAGYNRLMAFVRKHPKWPKVRLLTTFAERQLLWNQAPNSVLATHFRRNVPVSAAGFAAKAKLELSRGNKKAARKWLLKAWFKPKLGGKTRTAILQQFGSILGKADHERRLWILIHAQQTNSAIRTAGLVSRTHVKAAKAAQNLIKRRRNAVSSYKALPSSMRNKLALRYALARYYRKSRQFSSALSVLNSVSSKTSGVYDQAAWWVERRLVVRELLGPANRRFWPSLYQQARRHGFKKGKHFEEGEFLAGWIALRKLGNAKTAATHFTRMTYAAKSRTQQSRGAYWAARAYLVLGDKANTDKFFKRAARTPTLFYALLAREALGKGRVPIQLPRGRHDKATKNRMAGKELVRAVALIKRSGGDRELGSFTWPIARLAKTRSEASALAAILHSLGGPHLALRLSKAVGAFGIDIDNWSYPVRAMPKIKRIGKPVETAVVFAIARQESEFNARARSYVGARGLMQLMPGTAKGLARKYKVAHSTAKLTSQPTYNVMLGTALLGDLIRRFNGSYILTFVGYNAGPGNARKWIKRYGDPRAGKTDPIDWIESIPYTETRKYVQKVMQNVHIYRSQLNPRAMGGMSIDLARGTPPVVSAGGVKKSNAKCGGRKSLTSLIQDC